MDNEQLSAVAFSTRIVQLQFGSIYLNAYAWPIVYDKLSAFDKLTSGYRDALCRRIGKLLVRANEEPGLRLLFEFSDGSLIEIPLRYPALIGQYSAVLEHAVKGTIIAW